MRQHGAPGPRSDRGATATEYLGTIVAVTAVVGALVGTASRRDRPGGRTTAWLLTAVLCAALGLTTGCGTDTADGSIPAGWSTLRTKALSVSYPPAFAPQGGKTRSRYNAATAALSEGARTSR